MKFPLPKFIQQKKRIKTIADYERELILETGRKQFKKLDELGLFFQMFQMRLH